MNICVLASTNGTDLQAILDEMKAGRMEGVDLKFVLTDKVDCGAASLAKEAGVMHVFLDPRTSTTTLSRQKSGHLPSAGENLFKKDGSFPKLTREDYDRMVGDICDSYGVDLIVLVGWMRLFSADFVRKFDRRIINVHPSLLPKYPGMDTDVHRQVLDSGDKETGMTIHFVDEGMDTGEIILQKTCSVDPSDTVDSLKKKVQALEMRWLPEVIRGLVRNV